MSLLDKASLVQIPSGYGDNKLYSVVPDSGAGDFDFSRSSTGTRVNADGYIEEVPWNMLQYSEDYTQWTKSSNNTLVSGQTSPINTNTATAFEHNGTTAEYHIYRAVTLPSANVTVSAYLKKGTKNWVIFRVGNICLQYFDIENEVLGNNVFGSPISYNFVDVGNDWVRLDMTVLGNGASNNFNIYSAESASSSQVIGTSGDLLLYVWGAQVVKGTSPKPYIKTTDRLDVPRLDYRASCPTLKLEPQRTNLQTYSEDLTNGVWVTSNASVVANQTTSPDGNQTADKVDYGSGSGFIRNWVVTTSPATTFSIFVKYFDFQWIQIMTSGDSKHYANFDIQNGSLGNVGSFTEAEIEDYGNGWYRIVAKFVSGTFAGQPRLYKISSGVRPWAGGDGDAGSYYMWGGQQEVGAFQTSYIPTTSSTTTRNADVCNNAGTSATFNDSEGVLFVEIAALADDLSSRVISLNDGSTSNRVIILYQTITNTIRVIVSSAGSIQFDSNTQNYDITNFNKIALKYKENDFALWVNGTEVSTDISGLTPIGLNNLEFNNANGTSNFYGKVKQLIYFNEALTDTELTALTTI
jgi:hypothetical protein